MHQQVRTSTTKAGSPGPGAAYDDRGSVIDILQILSDAGVSLQTAGGSRLDKGGEFVFSVHHGDNEDDGPNDDAAQLLREHGYTVRVVYPHHCVVSDESGTLLDCIKEAQEKFKSVNEIFVGTPGDYAGIPVQVTGGNEDEEQRSAD
jgi:hypothetical protein